MLHLQKPLTPEGEHSSAWIPLQGLGVSEENSRLLFSVLQSSFCLGALVEKKIKNESI